MVKTHTISELEQALVKAKNAMMEYADTEDGGSCNFDTPVIRINATERQMAMLDYRVVKVDERGWRGWWFVFLPLMGQANRRTRMAEAACKSLKESGFEASVYYQLD